VYCPCSTKGKGGKASCYTSDQKAIVWPTKLASNEQCCRLDDISSHDLRELAVTIKFTYRYHVELELTRE
jgi:hypothetical protein